MQLPDLSKVYIFKFEKMSVADVEKLMLQTASHFEFYIPYETSKFKYVVGTVYSEAEVNNIKNYLALRDKELTAAEPKDLQDAESLLGIEYCYLRNVSRGQIPDNK